MSNKLKALGLALVAALALDCRHGVHRLGAVHIKLAPHDPLRVAENRHQRRFQRWHRLGAVTCENATFSGTGAATETETQTITPSYTSCKDSLGGTVHVTSGSYVFQNNGTVDTGGTFKLEVTNGAKTVICTVTISAQEGVNGITYKNLGGTSGMEVTSHSTNVKSQIEGGFFNCGTSTTNATAGTYDGLAVITGKDTSGVGVAISTD